MRLSRRDLGRGLASGTALTAMPAAAAASDPLAPGPLMDHLLAITGVSRQAKAEGLLDYGRIPGTVQDAMTTRLVERAFRAAEIIDVRVDSYDLPAQEWRLELVGLTLNTPTGPIALPSAFTPDQSPTTPPGGLTAPLIDIGRGTQEDRAGRDLTGKIVLVHSPVEGIAYDHPARTLVPELMQTGLAALIIAIRQPGDPQTRYAVQPGPLLYDPSTAPWAIISGADAVAIERAMAAAPGAMTATLTVEGSVLPPAKSQNVMAVVPGQGDEVVLITAHTDSRWQGALDNASGLSLLLGLAAHFAHAPKLKRTLVFVATGGHHNGPSSGQKRLITAHPDLIARTALIINLEHVGSREPGGNGGLDAKAGPNVMFIPNQNPGLTALVETGVAAHGIPVLRPVQTFWTADYYVHARLGMPAVMLLQAGFWYHTEADTPETIDPQAMSAMARLHADLIAGSDALSREDLKIGTPSLRYGN